MTGSIKQSENRPVLIGVAGGSGSGKTTFARALQARLGEDHCQIVYQDNFYIDQSHRFDHDGGAVNFDHPNAIDFPLLAQKLRELKQGKRVEIPVYDFASHKRKSETLPIQPCRVIVVDGILIFHAAEVCELFDDRIYFDAPEELRYQRRLERDVRERGRTPDGVRQQFLKQVKPMHDQFVEPSKARARLVVSDLASYGEILKRTVNLCGKLKPPGA